MFLLDAWYAVAWSHEIGRSQQLIRIDFENTPYGWRKMPLAVGPDPVKQVRGSQYRKDVARLVVELTRKVGYAIREEPDGLVIVIPTTTSTAIRATMRASATTRRR